MEDISRLQASRRGHKSHLTKVLNKANAILEIEHTQADETALTTIKTALEQLTKKQQLIRELDGNIAEKITKPEDLEAEIYESEELSYDLEEKLNHIRKYIELCSLSSQSDHSTHEIQPTMVSPSPETPTTSHETPTTSHETPSTMVYPNEVTHESGNPQQSPHTQQNSTNVLTDHSLPSPSPSPQLSAASNPPQNICRLPKLSLPVFSGNPLEWQSFWDSFDAAVHSNTSLNGIQRFNYLKAQLKGEALITIAGFPLTSSNYDEAINLLKDRFGQPHKIVNAHMHALLEIAQPHEHLDSFRSFYDTLETHIRGLACLGKGQESYGDLLVPIILGKLRTEFRKNLAREHGTLDWTIEQLRNAIHKELTILEAGQFVNTKTSTHQQITSSITSSFHTHAEGIRSSPPYPLPYPPQPPHYNRPTPKCIFCQRNHSSNVCQVITNTQQRYDVVKKANLCFNCLGHHKASLCHSKNRCKNCNRKHHTSLCKGENQSQKNTPVLTAFTPTQSTPAPSTQVMHEIQTALLKTAVATVHSTTTCAEANILFDEGAQRSFIAQSLATKLGLSPTRKETINLSAFGATTAIKRNLDVATINIETESSGTIPIQVLIVPKIATPIQNKVRASIKTIPHLKHLKLAHPVTSDENFEISLLIGVDHYWDFVEDRIIRGNGPTAMQSKLGYLLSGPIKSTMGQTTPTNVLSVLINHHQEDEQLEKFWSLESLGITPPTSINESAKFPILLPAHHPFTTLVIDEIHNAQLHSGVNSTLTALRDRFWIPRARQIIKHLLRKCVTCRKQVGKPFTNPDPAPLPKWRVQGSTPFSVTGVDFTGALFVKTPTKEEKVYICLFTCAATRAVHLEIVEDLSEETFLQAFRRFASRKSLPRKIVSDNASTYLSAAEELARLFQSPSLKEAFNRRGVDWQFIPKRAPWYGGFWERLIGLTKTVLKKVLGRAHVTLSSLQTIIVEIEAVLNDRPLTYVSSEIDDEEPLTPSHLLYGRRITSLPHPNVEDDEIDDPDFGNNSEVTRRAQVQALILKHFWLRWKSEYLTSLREFHKTTGKNDQTIHVGEVVLIHDDTPRIKWRLAVIESLIEGKDGFIRAANLRTSTGQTNRPIAKLYPLEVRTDIIPEAENRSEDADVAQPKEIRVRARRTAAKKALDNISKWTDILNAPPEDVVDSYMK